MKELTKDVFFGVIGCLLTYGTLGLAVFLLLLLGFCTGFLRE